MVSQHSQRKRYAKWRIDRAIHEAVTLAESRNCGKTFIDLLCASFEYSNMLSLRQHGSVHHILRGLVSLAENRRHWVRTHCDWRSCAGSPIRQFASLAQHLMAQATVPDFMTKVWFLERSQESLRQQRIYKHLARGNHIRGASLPIELSKEACQFFAQTPHHFTVNQAVRWSQIRGFGGSEQLASAIASTELGEDFRNDRFWNYFLSILASSKILEPAQVGPIVEFIREQGISTELELHRIAPQARLQTLLRKVSEWRKSKPSPRLTWQASGLRGFRYVPERQHEWSSLHWTIEELTDSSQLFQEGKALRHCVSSYARYCVNGISSIWSMKSVGSLSEQRRLTIEVDPSQRLVRTALGYCNRSPEKDARNVLELWAEREGLRIAKHV